MRKEVRLHVLNFALDVLFVLVNLKLNAVGYIISLSLSYRLPLQLLCLTQA